MNPAQRIVLFLGLIAIVILCLRPPYQWENTTYLVHYDTNVPHKAETSTVDAGHHWIWTPPQGAQTESDEKRTSRTAIMDWSRLGIYAGLAAIVALFGAFVVFGGRKKIAG